jgi:hypothetical protein
MCMGFLFSPSGLWLKNTWKTSLHHNLPKPHISLLDSPPLTPLLPYKSCSKFLLAPSPGIPVVPSLLFKYLLTGCAIRALCSTHLLWHHSLSHCHFDSGSWNLPPCDLSSVYGVTFVCVWSWGLNPGPCTCFNCAKLCKTLARRSTRSYVSVTKEPNCV